jgi:WhiB family redox-sensing transcriptional regulator
VSDRAYLIPGASTTSHATPYMTLQIPEETWMDDAACLQVDPDMFFPEGGGSGSHEAQTAKTVCRRCPVRRDCLVYALAHGEDIGIWGGLSSRQRRAIRAQERAS